MRSKLLLILVVIGLSACLEDSFSKQDQLAKDIAKIDAYLEAHPDPSSILVKDASGVRLVISQLGTGVVPPNPENDLVVAYTGRLFSNGQVFDSRSTSEPLYIRLSDGVIDGWSIGLGLITQGAKAKLYIPSTLGYGNTEKSNIPKNSILVFDIELMSVEATAAQVTRHNSDVVAIENKLADETGFMVHESGIHYKLQPIGTGPVPNPYDPVAIKFSGKLMADGTTYQAETTQGPTSTYSSMVYNHLHGLIIGLQLMHEGDKATFYIPSGLGFGPVAVGTVPANSNLIIEVELLDVLNQ